MLSPLSVGLTCQNTSEDTHLIQFFLSEQETECRSQLLEVISDKAAASFSWISCILYKASYFQMHSSWLHAMIFIYVIIPVIGGNSHNLQLDKHTER